MALGVGGSNFREELGKLSPEMIKKKNIPTSEYLKRIKKLMSLLINYKIDAIYLDSSSNLSYFTGLKITRSERLHGAIITSSGEVGYICPAFEKEKTTESIIVDGQIFVWEEHQNPACIITKALIRKGIKNGTIAIDEQTTLIIYESIKHQSNGYKLISASSITKNCREIKSELEISFIKMSMGIALKVQKAAAAILHEGITTTEVQEFIIEAHKRLGSTPPAFNIVLFGEATAYPHGVPYPQTLRYGDNVLIDIGATVGGYYSDLTRTYVFGEATRRQREIWDLEREAQQMVFKSAKIGSTCESLDFVARSFLESHGLGPGYKTPGLPHRTGHGLGLDIHEHPFIVKGNKDLLQEGMCFSNEPMICIYGEFGVRLEDHIYISKEGPVWFTEPAYSIDDPFGQNDL